MTQRLWQELCGHPVANDADRRMQPTSRTMGEVYAAGAADGTFGQAFRLSSQSNSTSVDGVISTRPGVSLNMATAGESGPIPGFSMRPARFSHDACQPSQIRANV
jgi:hypothetical protein